MAGSRSQKLGSIMAFRQEISFTTRSLSPNMQVRSIYEIRGTLAVLFFLRTLLYLTTGLHASANFCARKSSSSELSPKLKSTSAQVSSSSISEQQQTVTLEDGKTTQQTMYSVAPGPVSLRFWREDLCKRSLERRATAFNSRQQAAGPVRR